MRETTSADSMAEVLTWRIDAILKTTPSKPTEADLYQPGPTLPPWLPPPPPAADRAPLARYLTEAANLISVRTGDLTETALRDRPPWLTSLGQPPSTLYQHQQWLRHVAVVAAYRDQCGITNNDPAQPIGPHLELSNPSHAAYQYATRSLSVSSGLAAPSASHLQAFPAQAGLSTINPAAPRIRPAQHSLRLVPPPHLPRDPGVNPCR
jgi:hypothetical protein